MHHYATGLPITFLEFAKGGVALTKLADFYSSLPPLGSLSTGDDNHNDNHRQPNLVSAHASLEIPLPLSFSLIVLVR